MESGRAKYSPGFVSKGQTAMPCLRPSQINLPGEGAMSAFYPRMKKAVAPVLVNTEFGATASQ